MTPRDDTPGQAGKPDVQPASLPLLPLRNTVLFPGLFIPLSVGRPHSLAAIEAVLATEEKTFLVAAQKDGGDETPGLAELHNIGTRAVIKKMARNENVIELLVQGIERVRLVAVEQTEPYLMARYEPHPLPEDDGAEVEAMQGAVIDLAVKVLELAEVSAPVSIQQLVTQSADPLRFAFLMASMLSLDTEKEQNILEATTRLKAAVAVARVHDARDAGARAAQVHLQQGADGDDQAATRLHAPQATGSDPERVGRGDAREGPRWLSCAAGWQRQTCRPRRARRPSANCRAWSACRPRRQITMSSARTSSWCWNCRGRRPRWTSSTWFTPARCWTRTTTGWTR